MRADKIARLEAAGWAVGTVGQFLAGRPRVKKAPADVLREVYERQTRRKKPGWKVPAKTITRKKGRASGK